MGNDRIDLALIVAGEEADVRVEKLTAEPCAKAQFGREHEAEARHAREVREGQRCGDRGEQQDDVACRDRRACRQGVDGEDHARACQARKHRVDEDRRTHQVSVPDEEGKERQQPARAFA